MENRKIDYEIKDIKPHYNPKYTTKVNLIHTIVLLNITIDELNSRLQTLGNKITALEIMVFDKHNQKY